MNHVKRMAKGTKAPTGATVELVFPWSCAVSSNYRTAFHGGRHKLSVRYRAALKEAHLRAMSQYRGAKLAGPLKVHLKVWMPDKRRRDAPNLAKLILDSMQGIVYADDTQVTDLRVTNEGVDRENPRIEVTVQPR